MKTVTIKTKQCFDITLRLQVPNSWDDDRIADELTDGEMLRWYNDELRRVFGAMADGDSVDWRTFPHDFQGSRSNIDEPQDVLFENPHNLMTPGAPPPPNIMAYYQGDNS